MRTVVKVAATAVLGLAIAGASIAADPKPVTQTASVDNTKMGAYRALAQLSYQAFQKGDMATAAELSRVLERTWDAAEGGGGDRSLAKTNKDLFGQLDKAMDAYIKPILRYATKAPDPSAVLTAYNEFLAKLELAE